MVDFLSREVLNIEGGISRNGLAQINADGSVSSFNPRLPYVNVGLNYAYIYPWKN